MNEIENRFYECVKDTIRTGFIKKIKYYNQEIKYEFKKYDEEIYGGLDADDMPIKIYIETEEFGVKKIKSYLAIFSQQVTIENGFIVDFYIYTDSLQQNVMCIEIDGHEWHEKTKEQAQRDKKRDRVIMSYGYNIIHFTASEIFTNCQGCVEEFIDIYVKNIIYKLFEYTDELFIGYPVRSKKCQ